MAGKVTKFRRPSNDEKELSVVSDLGSSLIAMQLPGGKSDQWEMLSSDDLLTRRGFRVYREMRADDQVKACLWLKKMLIAGRSWEIVPRDKAGDASQKKSGKVKAGGFGSGPSPVTPVPAGTPSKTMPQKPKSEAAKWIEGKLQELPMKQFIFEALTAFDYGACFGELVWEIDDEYKFALKDIAFRDPQYMHIITDSHGNIETFQQQPQLSLGIGGRVINIPPEKMFHWAYQSEFRNHWGQSDLRAAYRAWWSKKYVTQFFNVFLERFGSPLMMMKYPPGSTPELKNALKQIMQSLSSKTDILVPEGVSVELIEATRAGTAKFEEALKLYDNAIAHAILMPGLLGNSDIATRGSDSQSRLHLKTLMKMIQFICEQLEAVITEKIIEPMVDKNFNEDEELCFRFQDYGEFESFQISDAIKELHNAGILSLDSVDTNYIRSILGLSLRGEDNPDTVERPMLNQLPGMPGGNAQAEGGGAKSGNDRAAKGASTKKTDSQGRVKAEDDQVKVVVNVAPPSVNVNPSIHIPDINVKVPDINVPEIKFPDRFGEAPVVNVPAPVVNVSVPEQKTPVVNVKVPEQRKRKFRVKREGNETTMVEE